MSFTFWLMALWPRKSIKWEITLSWLNKVFTDSLNIPLFISILDTVNIIELILLNIVLSCLDVIINMFWWLWLLHTVLLTSQLVFGTFILNFICLFTMGFLKLCLFCSFNSSCSSGRVLFGLLCFVVMTFAQTGYYGILFHNSPVVVEIN